MHPSSSFVLVLAATFLGATAWVPVSAPRTWASQSPRVGSLKAEVCECDCEYVCGCECGCECGCGVGRRGGKFARMSVRARQNGGARAAQTGTAPAGFACKCVLAVLCARARAYVCCV